MGAGHRAARRVRRAQRCGPSRPTRTTTTTPHAGAWPRSSRRRRRWSSVPRPGWSTSSSTWGRRRSEGAPDLVVAAGICCAVLLAPPPAAAFNPIGPVCGIARHGEWRGGQGLQLGGKLLGAGKKVVSGGSSSGLGTKAQAAVGLAALGAWVLVGGAKSALHETATVLDNTTRQHLTTTWFSSTYWRMAGIAALLDPALPVRRRRAGVDSLRSGPAGPSRLRLPAPRAARRRHRGSADDAAARRHRRDLAARSRRPPATPARASWPTLEFWRGSSPSPQARRSWPFCRIGVPRLGRWCSGSSC